ncbi:MAG: VWA domain-containing protein [Bacilli bacterium]|nr:VWA domain-containing protein [Bacilli bacterium]
MSDKKKLERDQKEKQILEQFDEYIELSKNPPKKEKKNEPEEIEILEDEKGNVKLQDLIITKKDKVERIQKEPEDLIEEEPEEKIQEFEPSELKEPEISKTMFDLDLEDYLEKNKIVEEAEDVDEDFWEEKIRLDEEEPKKIHFLKPIAATFSFLMVVTLLVGIVSKTNIGSLAMNASSEENEVEIVEHDIHIKKQAEWIAKNKASLRITVDSEMEYDSRARDIVIMLDTSNGMKNQMNQIKNDLVDYIDFVLEENENSRIAIISYNNKAVAEESFTNDSNKLKSKIRNITLAEGRNYNEALKRLNQMLITYSVKERPLKVLLISGGIPDDGNYSISGTYAILKDEYENMEIEGIQYNMGEEELEDLKNATDRVWISNSNSFSNILKEASLDPEKIKLEVSEIISNNFQVKSINTSYGSTKMDGQKIVWDVSKNRFATGSKAELEIILELTKDNSTKMDEFQLSEKTIFESDGGEKKELDITPTLKNYYEVKYIGNGPTGCKFEVPKTQKHYVYEVVKVEEKEPSCEGFDFRGWTISGDEKKLNDKLFIMPTHDVEIRGVWSTFKITSQMR